MIVSLHTILQGCSSSEAALLVKCLLGEGVTEEKKLVIGRLTISQLLAITAKSLSFFRQSSSHTIPARLVDGDGLRLVDVSA